MSQHYILLNGSRDSSDQSRNALKSELIEKCALDPIFIDDLFNNLPSIISYNLSSEEAESYLKFFTNLGADLEICKQEVTAEDKNSIETKLLAKYSLKSFAIPLPQSTAESLTGIPQEETSPFDFLNSSNEQAKEQSSEATDDIFGDLIGEDSTQEKKTSPDPLNENSVSPKTELTLENANDVSIFEGVAPINDSLNFENDSLNFDNLTNIEQAPDLQQSDAEQAKAEQEQINLETSTEETQEKTEPLEAQNSIANYYRSTDETPVSEEAGGTSIRKFSLSGRKSLKVSSHLLLAALLLGAAALFVVIDPFGIRNQDNTKTVFVSPKSLDKILDEMDAIFAAKTTADSNKVSATVSAEAGVQRWIGIFKEADFATKIKLKTADTKITWAGIEIIATPPPPLTPEELAKNMSSIWFEKFISENIYATDSNFYIGNEYDPSTLKGIGRAFIVGDPTVGRISVQITLSAIIPNLNASEIKGTWEIHFLEDSDGKDSNGASTPAPSNTPQMTVSTEEQIKDKASSTDLESDLPFEEIESSHPLYLLKNPQSNKYKIHFKGSFLAVRVDNDARLLTSFSDM